MLYLVTLSNKIGTRRKRNLLFRWRDEIIALTLTTAPRICIQSLKKYPPVKTAYAFIYHRFMNEIHKNFFRRIQHKIWYIWYVMWLPRISYVFCSLIIIIKRELASFHHPLWIRSSWSSCRCALFLYRSWMDRPSCG